jgi:hypothetical protein
MLADFVLPLEHASDLEWFFSPVAGRLIDPPRHARVAGWLRRLSRGDLTTLRARYGPAAPAAQEASFPGLSRSALPLPLLLLAARRKGILRATLRAWCAARAKHEADIGRLYCAAFTEIECVAVWWNHHGPGAANNAGPSPDL